MRMRNEIIPPLAVIVFTRSTVRSPSLQGGKEDAAQDESQGLPGEVHINNYAHQAAPPDRRKSWLPVTRRVPPSATLRGECGAER